MRVQFDIVLFQILEKLVGAKNLSNFHELVIVVVSVEERLLAEDLHQVKLGLAASQSIRT